MASKLWSKKNPGTSPGFSVVIYGLSSTLNIGSLFSFRTLGNVKRYLLAFFEGFETRHSNRAEVREQLFFTIIRFDKAKTFCIIEPLNNSGRHANSIT